jgi:hypothetical protein
MAHTIAWFIEYECVQAQLSCTEPSGAPCRMVCPEECESWPCAHELVDNVDCNPIVFITEGAGVVESYEGERTPLRDGLVEFKWNGDWYTWTYPGPM